LMMIIVIIVWDIFGKKYLGKDNMENIINSIHIIIYYV
jgi:hypothetical protein